MASVRSALTDGVAVGQPLTIPINHFAARTSATRYAARLRDEDRVVLRYVGEPERLGRRHRRHRQRGGNVVGLMPHPERASSPLLGSSDGLVLLESILPLGHRDGLSPGGPRRRGTTST